MSETFAALVSRTHDWFERAQADGWLSDRDLARFASLERRTPADLFANAQHRPLVVAFFGGTGVGKSSLLNRLAGEAIARTGVERPTSRELTIYLHDSVELAKLPPELPVERVHVKRHPVDSRRNVLWIDAPDIDSTEQRNRELALAWLPHVDLLIYVVSPERYRDDVGWRVLRQRGEKHGWMFVLNRWDEGDASQAKDFAGMLRDAGFSQPLLLCTSCLDAAVALPTPDQFEQIEAAIRALLAEHGVRELERLGHRARLLQMRDVLQVARRRFGDDAQWKNVDAARQRHWLQTRTALIQGLEWPIRAAAGRFAIRQRGLLGRVVREAMAARAEARSLQSGTGEATAVTEARGSDARSDGLDIDATELTRSLWDDWTRDKLAGCLDAIEVEVRRTDVAAAPLRARLDATAEQAGQVVLQSVRERLRLALARPGTALRRVLRRVTGFLMAALPLLALLWVAYNVVEGYVQASAGKGDYLGTNFAVNSVLLILVAWAVPFVFDRLLRPSLERTALEAMRQGLVDGLERLDRQLRDSVAEVAALARSRADDATRILGEISRSALQPVDASKASLSRLLVTPARRPVAARS